MKKDDADKLIKDYIKPLYGFSMNKTKNINEAEELASRIILQVYDVLIKKDKFIDLNSYIFKIAHNVWTKYINNKTKVINNMSIDKINISSDLDIDKEIIKSEVADKLRLEISFLTKQQREIVILHYYKGLKIREIAEKLHLSEGTVKWHLYESKKEMKKGMKIMRTVGNLGINPIKFSSMWHFGQPGEMGETKDFFKKSITQNIAYAAYQKPLTINKIAEELGISPIFVEDEINELEEYGFMNKLPGGKFQTNMLILENTDEKYEALNEIYIKFADILVEEYFLQFFNMEDKFKYLNVYYPNNDFNLLLWSIIPYTMKNLEFSQLNKIPCEEVSVLRKDGGNYIATAYIDKEISGTKDFNSYQYSQMYRINENPEIIGWQLNSPWSNRKFNWKDNITSDYVGLYHFINGNLIENNINIDIYRRLIDKGYLIKNKNGYKVNLVYCKNKKITDEFNKILPSASDKLLKLGQELDEKVYQIEKIYQPLHIYKTLRYMCQNKLTDLKVYVLKNLIHKGLLKIPNSEEAKGISTILFVKE